MPHVIFSIPKGPYVKLTFHIIFYCFISCFLSLTAAKIERKEAEVQEPSQLMIVNQAIDQKMLEVLNRPKALRQALFQILTTLGNGPLHDLIVSYDDDPDISTLCDALKGFSFPCDDKGLFQAKASPHGDTILHLLAPQRQEQLCRVIQNADLFGLKTHFERLFQLKSKFYCALVNAVYADPDLKSMAECLDEWQQLAGPLSLINGVINCQAQAVNFPFLFSDREFETAFLWAPLRLEMIITFPDKVGCRIQINHHDSPSDMHKKVKNSACIGQMSDVQKKLEQCNGEVKVSCKIGYCINYPYHPKDHDLFQQEMPPELFRAKIIAKKLALFYLLYEHGAVTTMTIF